MYRRLMAYNTEMAVLAILPLIVLSGTLKA
jgi:hypothetical protein